VQSGVAKTTPLCFAQTRNSVLFAESLGRPVLMRVRRVLPVHADQIGIPTLLKSIDDFGSDSVSSCHCNRLNSLTRFGPLLALTIM
jgi:hypothetical protein